MLLSIYRRRQIKLAYKHPAGVLSALKGGREGYRKWKSDFFETEFSNALMSLTGASAEEIKVLKGQFLSSPIHSEVDETLEKIGKSKTLAKKMNYSWFYYALIRLAKPKDVIETGVWFGFSTAFLLQGLEDNGSGKLYSIDLPNAQYEFPKSIYNPQGRPSKALVGQAEHTGILVPDRLRPRWELIIGKSQEKLGPLLDKLQQIDLFIHDGEHTDEDMMYEFETAWKHLTPRGILVADDVHVSSAFPDFCRKQGVRPIFVERAFSKMFNEYQVFMGATKKET